MEIKQVNFYDILDLYNDENSSFQENYKKGYYSYLDLQYSTKGTFLLAIENNEVIGIIQYDKNPHIKEYEAYSMCFVATHPQYKGRGIATKLIETMILKLIGVAKSIIFSYYSDEGIVLASCTQRFAQQYKGQIEILHRTRSGVYQNALYPLLKEGYRVIVDDPDNNLVNSHATITYLTHEITGLKISIKVEKTGQNLIVSEDKITSIIN